MNQVLIKSMWLFLAVCFFGNRPVSAQNPDWPMVPQNLHFTTGGSTGTIMPGSYTTPYFASNSAQGGSGNLLFNVVNEKIYDNAGVLIGSTGPSWASWGKDIAIVPDPSDCQAHIILSAYVDLIVGGGNGNYEWRILGTRVSKNGATWNVQQNYFDYTISGCDNAYMSLAVRKPNSLGERIFYVVLNRGVYLFKVQSGGISYVSDTQLGGSESPTDADISPSGDRLIWTDRIYELHWFNLNTSTGSLMSYGNRPIDFMGAYYSYGVEFVDNNTIWVSALEINGLTGGIYQCTFGNPIATQISTNMDYGKSQLEKALDGKIYAASANNLWGKNPSNGTTATISIPVNSSDFWGSGSEYFSLPEQLDYEDYAQIFNCGCPVNVTITGSYSLPLTESQTWIKTSGACSIAANSTVKLDADPQNGYIELNTGFIADATQNIVFVAQAFNGCAPGAPLRPIVEARISDMVASETKHERPTLNVFPNPTSGEMTLEFGEALESETIVTLMDLTGRTILQTLIAQGESNQTFSLAAYPSGIYILRASTKGKPILTQKIVKE